MEVVDTHTRSCPRNTNYLMLRWDKYVYDGLFWSQIVIKCKSIRSNQSCFPLEFPYFHYSHQLTCLHPHWCQPFINSISSQKSNEIVKKKLYYLISTLNSRKTKFSNFRNGRYSNQRTNNQTIYNFHFVSLPKMSYFFIYQQLCFTHFFRPKPIIIISIFGKWLLIIYT